MSKLVSSRIGRREQLSQQERLIEQRKREIENKLKQLSKADDSDKSETNISSSDDTSHPNDNQIETIDNKDVEETSSSVTVSSSVNKFANDGSFFEQFLKMQKSVEQNKELNIPPEENETKPTIKAIKMVVKENKSKLKAINCCEDSNVKLSDDDDNKGIDLIVNKRKDILKYAVRWHWTSEDKDIQSAIERTAISVTINGIEAEETMRETKAEDINYSWLRDKDSEYYKSFLKRVEELSEAKTRAQNDGLLSTDGTESDLNESKGIKRQRKSRWSDEKVEVKPDTALIQYAIQVFGNTNLSAEQWKQLEDQRKMKMLCQMLKEKQTALQMMANAGKVKYEYDSDEDTTDGTWEHKRRRQEMHKTQQLAIQLTESGSGKHHIGDFMPPEELEKFMQKWETLKEGTPISPDSDYKDSKLESDNVGFQMLKKMGWIEGQGLGFDGTGISEPINKSFGGGNNSGLGQIRPQELKEGDDEYEAYRKRMMMAYRFRPNPLNNPRRAYY